MPTDEEMKISIMRMPGLHIMMPNYAVFGDTPIIYNMYKDYDQHDATHAFEFLKLKGKVDSETEEIFRSHVEKYLKVPIPEPPVPSLIIYNDGVSQQSRYSIFQHQEGKISSIYTEPGDGTVTSQGANYACGHWKSSTCKNLHDTTNHADILSSEVVTKNVFDYIESPKPIQNEEKLGLFMASGFQGSPLYATVTDPSKATMCPSNLNHTLFYTTFYDSKKLIDDSGKYWLSNECIAMLTRVELDVSEKFVTYAPGIHLESSKFGEIDHLLSYSTLFKKAFQQEGYTHYKNLFGVGYNYMLHPLMSNEVYESLKQGIEKYYYETGQRAVITGHSQGTSFVEIFITDYVTKEWAQKFVQGVIFYAPAFAGWGTYGRSVNGAYESGFPDSIAAMKTSTQRMPGLHIMMPNEGVFGSKTVIKDFPNPGDNSNSSFVCELLKKLNRMDNTAETIFHLTDKYRKNPLPEPPVPSLIIFNNKTTTQNGYNYVSSSNSVSQFSGIGDGTVSSDGPEWACKNWKNVQCYNYNLGGISHSNIQDNQITVDLTFSFIKNIQKFRPLEGTNYLFYSGAFDKYADTNYVDKRKIDSSRLSYSASGEKSGFEISKIFDDNPNTYWVSNLTNTDKHHNFIFINFDTNVSLEAFLYDTIYENGNNYRTFKGFPYQLKVYSTSGNKPYVLTSLFIGTPTFPSTRFQFVFKEPVYCDSIKIEFIDISPGSDNVKNPTVAGLTLIENIEAEVVSTIPTSSKYTATYISEHRATNNEFKYDGSEGLSDRQLSNAFDDNIKTFWIAKTENTDSFHNYIDITFNKRVDLDAIIYDAGYSSKEQIFHGFPKKLNIYSSVGNEELKLNTVFVGTPTWPNKQYQFEFKRTITCEKIRLEFIDVTPESSKQSGKLCPLVGNLFFIKKDELQEGVMIPAETQYTNSEHISESKILNTQFDYSASSQRNNRVIANAFDDNDNTFWIASTPNSETYHNYIDVTFKNTVILEAILYDSGFSSNTQSFLGFPLKILIHASLGSDDLKPIILFTGSPTWPDKKYQLVFPDPLTCDKIRFEFVEVTPEFSVSNYELCPLVTNLYFLKKVNKLKNATMNPTSGNYANSDYLSVARIPSSAFSYESTEYKPDYPISSAFDDNINTSWVAKNPNTDDFHNTISVTFSNTVKLDAILYDTAYIPSSETFVGAPKKIIVHTQLGNEQLHQHTMFSGELIWENKQYQFVFDEPVKCDKIMIEFIEVTPDTFSSDGGLNPIVSNLFFIQAFDYDVIQTVPSTNDFIQGLYKQQHRVQNNEFKYDGSEGLSDRQLPNAFDDKTNTFWIAKTENTDSFHNYIDITFNEQIQLEGIIYDAGYSTAGQIFHGFPKKLNIYSSIGNEELKLNTVFVGTPTWPNKQYQFEFKKPLSCDKIRLEFIDVTPESSKQGGKLCPLVGNLMLYKSIEYDIINYSYVKGRFSNNDYVNEHTIARERFTPTSSGSLSGYPLENIFDNRDSFWVANAETTKTLHNYIEIGFKSVVSLDGFIYQAGISTSTKTFHGFPLKLLVHSSIGEEQLKARTMFYGSPEWGNVKYQFVFKEPIICDKIRIEFIENTLESSKTGGTYKPLCNNLYLIEDIVAVPDPTMTPFPTPSSLPEEISCHFNHRCEAEGTEEKKVNVGISSSDFIDLENDVNGGAIRLVNTQFKIESVKVTNCNALKGGGGGVYIYNEMNTPLETEHLDNIVFTGCSAEYGGAVFIHSNQIENPVTITNCIFTGNSVTSNDNDSCLPTALCGGSAVFLQAKSSVMQRNKFRDSVGNGGIVKLVYLDSDSLLLSNINNFINKKKGLISISECNFEINQLSDCCLFYAPGNERVELNLSDSVFVGNLRNGAHYINGISHSKTPSKLFVRTCKFASSLKDSFGAEIEQLISGDLKNQMFFYNEKQSNKNEKNSLKLIMASVSLVFAAILLVLVANIIIKLKKKNENTKIDNNNDDASLDQFLV